MEGGSRVKEGGEWMAVESGGRCRVERGGGLGEGWRVAEGERKRLVWEIVSGLEN